jgi:ElaB/YqjD/DUF883 family membrane-anchored ribosome-binding protein
MSSFRTFRDGEASTIVVAWIAAAERFATIGDLGAMNASMKVEPDLAIFREDLDALKRDVASLIDHMRNSATNSVQNVSGEVERRVRSLRQQVGAEGDRSARALHVFLQDQPFVALTIAVGIGYVGARVLRR